MGEPRALNFLPHSLQVPEGVSVCLTALSSSAINLASCLKSSVMCYALSTPKSLPLLLRPVDHYFRGSSEARVFNQCCGVLERGLGRNRREDGQKWGEFVTRPSIWFLVSSIPLAVDEQSSEEWTYVGGQVGR